MRSANLARLKKMGDASHKDAATAAFYLGLDQRSVATGALGRDSHRFTKSKKEPILIVRPILFAGKAIMQRAILRSCALFILAVLCVPTSLCRVIAQQPPQTREGIITTFAPVVEKVAPSVVTVFTTQTVSRGQTAFSFSDDALRQFFGGRAPQSQGKQTLQGLGSGIVRPDGYILTANHVVSGADEIMIGLGNDLRRFKAKKVGTDPGTDVALLKIDENNLPSMNFADSDKARAGDIVLAIGNPFGLRQTVTMGIISAVGRGGIGIVDYENFIQTDAAINMGNSGGALVDIEGRLFGINTAIFSRSGGNQGIGFAIPANLAREVMQSLRDKGRVVRGSSVPRCKASLRK